MNNREKAIHQFNQMNCNQSVITVFGPQLGVPENVCFNMGLAFGSGMGRQGKTCGAVTGAYMAIGLWSAKQFDDTRQQKKLAVEKVAEFNRRFLEKHGSLDCKTLLKYDLSLPAEAEKAAEMGLFDTVCPELVGSSADILTTLLP